MACNNIIGHLEKDFDESFDSADKLYKFRDLIAYQGSFIHIDKATKGQDIIF